MEQSTSNDSALLPQYGFGATYSFDALVEHHHFLYRVHTPKRRGTHSRPVSPSPRSSSPLGSSRRAALTRSPSSSLSASVASIRSSESDYFGYAPSHAAVDEDDAAPGDPYFLSRKFKDDLSSPDPGQRRRTISTLSTLSGGSAAYSFIGSEDGSDVESEHAASLRRRGTLSRSSSMMLGHSRVRSDSLTSGHPSPKRSQSADVHELIAPSLAPKGTEVNEGTGAVMTYSDLVRHLDWTTRSSSPYVTTSFSFFWCLWEAVRRYKLGVKHDVEIAVIDARKLRGRARTALEVLRSVEQDKQDKAYWKWYRFALESQDVLVFGAISGDAIYASIPLAQILPKLPSYLFVDEVPKAVADPREPDSSIDPRSPTSQTQNPIFPSTPSRPRSPRGEREQEREALSTVHLLTKLAWDIGTTLKPIRKSKDVPRTPSKPAPRHTPHAEFCKALSAAFARRSEAEQLRDATTGAVGLAELLIEPWFRARCAEVVAYPFRHDDDSDDEKEGGADKMNDSVCLGLAGDGCTLEHSHDSSIQDALFEKDEETEEEAARREAATVLLELALSLARWPAALWYAEHAETIEALVNDVVNMCVTEAARGVQGRIAWSIALEGERQRTRRLSASGSMRSRADTMSLSGSLHGSLRSERRGREETRERDRSRSRSPFSGSSTKHVRLAGASEGSPSPSPKSSLRESPYKPRARSPLGASPVLGPAIVIRPKSKTGTGAGADATTSEIKQKSDEAWSPSTPPPSPPRSEGELRGVGPVGRRSPPPPPPPRSSRRPPSPPQSLASSLASLDSPLPSPNASPAASLTPSSLLKRSLHRRAESIPGSWPGGDSSPEDRPGSPSPSPSPSPEAAGRQSDSKEQERDVFWDPSIREAAKKKRPLSWAGSGIAFGAGALSSSASSSAESLRAAAAAAAAAAQSSLTSSPSSSARHTPSRSQSDSQVRGVLLAEVVSSALGLGAEAGAAAGSEAAKGGSPLRLDTSSSSESTSGPERHHRHRRHSSHGYTQPKDVELSPVREAEQEDEPETEEESSKESVESVENFEREVAVHDDDGAAAHVGVTHVDVVEELKSSQSDKAVLPAGGEVVVTQLSDSEAGIDASDVQQTVAPSSGSSTPRRQRSRSATLASIPEEDWADWSLVEAPSAAEYEVEAERPRVELKVEEADVPLPPSPKSDSVEFDAETQEVEQEALEIEVVRKVPEITLSVDTGVPQRDDKVVVDDPGYLSPISAASDEWKARETSKALVPSRIFISPFNVSLREPLAKTRVFFSTFLVLPVFNLVRKITPTTLSLPPMLSPMPSPIFEDSEAPSTYSRLSRFFSFFRIPLIHPGSRFFLFRQSRQEPQQQQQQSRRSMAAILAPPPRWDAPIPECRQEPPADTNDMHWDARSTSWLISCFLCGVTAALVLAAAQQRRYETHMLIGNRYH